MVRPQIGSLRELKSKKIAVTGVASVATFMFKQVAPKYGLDANDLTFIDSGPGQRLAAMMSGVVDAGLLSTEDRYSALDQGMKDLMYLGKEVKNSSGTIATTDRFIKEQPKLIGFMRATLKALRLVKHNREVAVDAIVKFSEVKRELAERTYDEVIRTFASNGVVDEETQKNDLDIVRLVANGNKEVPIERAYNLSFAAQADKDLTRVSWRP
jgi:ABC-type nitrate/sulfonate/bicarbonate transport system substrate-binding protein